MNSIKDILVIGGGLGGLMTAAILSKVGFKVTVLEKNHTVGGGLQCFQRYGKIFETGMHIMGGMLPGENVYRLCSWLGITDKLKIRLADAECMDFLWFYEEGKKYSLPSGRKAFYYPHGHETAQPVADRTECFPSWHVRRLAHGNQNCGMPYRARFYCKQDTVVNNYFDIFD